MPITLPQPVQPVASQSQGLSHPASSALASMQESFVDVSVQIDPEWDHMPHWQTHLGRLFAGKGAPLLTGGAEGKSGTVSPGAGSIGGTSATGPDTFHALFMTIDEEGIESNFEVNYEDTEILGRSEQYKTYTGGSNRVIPFTFQFWAQEGNVEDEVLYPAWWLESLKMPVVEGPTTVKIMHAPPPVILNVGTLIQNARCIVTEATVKWEAPFMQGTMRPHGATVTCVFTVVRMPTQSFPSALNRYEYAVG